MIRQKRPAKLLPLVFVLAVVVGVILLLRMNRQDQKPTEGKDSMRTVRKSEGKKTGSEIKDGSKDPTKPEEDKEPVEETGYSIAGQVIDEDGNGLAGADVIIHRDFSSNTFDFPTVTTVTTDRDGRFQADNLPTCSLLLAAKKQDYYFCLPGYEVDNTAGMFHPVPFIKDRSRETGLQLRMRTGALTAGRVVDEKGHPIENAFVTLSKASGFISQEFKVEITTDHEGWFRTTSLCPGEYLIGVTADGYMPPRPPLKAISGSDDLLLRLKQGVIVRGTVVSDDSMRAIPYAQVTATALRP